MRNNSFKSAKHSMNYQMLQLKRINKKQPVKKYSEEEKLKLAMQMGLVTVKK
jgi:hypothetical protein